MDKKATSFGRKKISFDWGVASTQVAGVLGGGIATGVSAQQLVLSLALGKPTLIWCSAALTFFFGGLTAFTGYSLWKDIRSLRKKNDAPAPK